MTPGTLVSGISWATSLALHTALLCGGWMLPWREPLRPVPAVIPVELIESQLAPPRPAATIAVARRELPGRRPMSASPPTLTEPPPAPPERLIADVQPAPKPPDARETPPPALAVVSSAPLASTGSVGSAGGVTTGEAQARLHSSPSESTAPAGGTAAIRPQSPAPSPITQQARPGGGYQVRPLYPTAARKAGAEGTTLLRVHVLRDGSIGEVQIERSAGHAALDRAVADAVSQWHFEPARSGSEPVAVWVVVPVEFRLRSAF